MAEADGLSGSDVVLYVNVGTEEAPDYDAVGSQRGVTFREQTAEIDMSSKESRSMRVKAGRYSATVSLTGLYVPDDDAYLALKDAFRAGDLILIHKSESDVEVEEASALITSMQDDNPDSAPATIAVELRIDGDWAEVGS